MIDYKNLFDYFRQCPFLANLMSIATESKIGTNVILPLSGSPTEQVEENIDVIGNRIRRITPYPTIYQDFQINCYVYYDTKDNNPPQYNSNILTYEEVCGVCDWISNHNANKIFPDIGENVIAIECKPFTPQEQGVDSETNMMCYFITARISYINRAEQSVMYYEC